VHDLQPRLEELRADDHRHRPAHQEHREREPQVHRADVLVVGGGEPARDAARIVRVVVVPVAGKLIVGEFIPTTKNQPAAEFLPQHGFVLGEGGLWHLALEEPRAVPGYFVVEMEG